MNNAAPVPQGATIARRPDVAARNAGARACLSAGHAHSRRWRRAAVAALVPAVAVTIAQPVLVFLPVLVSGCVFWCWAGTRTATLAYRRVSTHGLVAVTPKAWTRHGDYTSGHRHVLYWVVELTTGHRLVTQTRRDRDIEMYLAGDPDKMRHVTLMWFRPGETTPCDWWLARRRSHRFGHFMDRLRRIPDSHEAAMWEDEAERIDRLDAEWEAFWADETNE